MGILDAWERMKTAGTFAWMLVLSICVTVALVKIGHQASARYNEQQVTAAQAHTICVRSKVFGPSFLAHLERVEERLHTATLEEKVEWPTGSHKKVGVLDFYRTTIPKACPGP